MAPRSVKSLCMITWRNHEIPISARSPQAGYGTDRVRMAIAGENGDIAI